MATRWGGRAPRRTEDSVSGVRHRRGRAGDQRTAGRSPRGAVVRAVRRGDGHARRRRGVIPRVDQRRTGSVQPGSSGSVGRWPGAAGGHLAVDRRPVRAAILAARAGKIFGLVLIAGGVARVLFVLGLSGLWWQLLGWFLVQEAAAEEQRARLGRQVRRGDRGRRDVPATGRRRSADPGVTVHRPDGPGSPVLHVSAGRCRRPAHRAGDAQSDPRRCPRDTPGTPAGRHRLSPEEPLVDLLPRLGGCADGRAVVLDGDRPTRRPGLSAHVLCPPPATAVLRAALAV